MSNIASREVKLTLCNETWDLGKIMLSTEDPDFVPYGRDLSVNYSLWHGNGDGDGIEKEFAQILFNGEPTRLSGHYKGILKYTNHHLREPISRSSINDCLMFKNIVPITDANFYSGWDSGIVDALGMLPYHIKDVFGNELFGE